MAQRAFARISGFNSNPANQSMIDLAVWIGWFNGGLGGADATTVSVSSNAPSSHIRQAIEDGVVDYAESAYSVTVDQRDVLVLDDL